MSEGNPRLPDLEPDGMCEYGGPAAPAAAATGATSATGCGCVPVLAAQAGAALPPTAATTADPTITISITPTTGGQFDITVDKNESIENLKKIISKRLKVAKERICLLHRERQLRDGTLEENRLQDGSRLTLLPSVETGLLAQRPEQSVMQALESLSDSQVNDFLSGKAPLNLTMRLGDHMMLIQLQLSTVTPTGTTAATGPAVPAARSSRPQTPPTSQTSPETHESPSSARRSSGVFASTTTTAVACPSKLSLSSSLMGSLASAAAASSLFAAPSPSPPGTPSSPTWSGGAAGRSASPSCWTTTTATAEQPIQQPPPSTPPGTRQAPGLQHRHPSRHRHMHPPRHPYHHHHHHHHRYVKKVGQVAKPSCPSCNEAETTVTTPESGAKCSLILGQCYCSKSPKKKPCTSGDVSPTLESGGATAQVSPAAEACATTTTTTSTPTPTSLENSPDASVADPSANPTATLDTRALVEASRNLTQKLKQLSSEENAKRRQGAIIESMHHHGKGVYTGTFSGTLNPALQDRHGRPKRDISTIIHILNDLLCATPATTAGHYRYHRHPGAHRSAATAAAGPQVAATTTQSASMFSAGQTAPASTTNSSSLETAAACHDAPNPGYSSEELSKENEATKGKMRRLRLVMEQRREKMRARRQARAAPYTTKWAAVTPDPDPNSSPSSSSASSSGGSGGGGTKSTGDPQNEPELQPCSPEPVVA